MPELKELLRAAHDDKDEIREELLKVLNEFYQKHGLWCSISTPIIYEDTRYGKIARVSVECELIIT